MSEKKTIHSFNFWDNAVVELTEYPLTGGGDGRLDVEFNYINDFSFWESLDKKEAYMTFSADGLFVKILIKDSIYEKLTKEIQSYAKRRKELEKERVK